MDVNYQDILNQIKQIWMEKSKDAPTSWFKLSVKYLILASGFLVNVTDVLVNHMQTFDMPGVEKKTQVLSMLSEIFDFVSASAIPAVYKPFTSLLKTFVINCLLSAIIDFIVKKYKNGSWSSKNEETKKELFV